MSNTTSLLTHLVNSFKYLKSHKLVTSELSDLYKSVINDYTNLINEELDNISRIDDTFNIKSNDSKIYYLIVMMNDIIISHDICMTDKIMSYEYIINNYRELINDEFNSLTEISGLKSKSIYCEIDECSESESSDNSESIDDILMRMMVI